MADVAESPVKQELASSPTKSTADPTPQKRKASPADDDRDDAIKRTKVDSPDDRAHDARRMSHTSAGSRPDTRDLHHHDAPDDRGRRANATSKDEEKKRGKRLFGGLLGTLNQSGGGAQLKRRREIEQRQQERVQRQKLEAEKRSAERLSRITQVRRAEQINFEEKVMKTRHANLLARAHSLQTKSEPRIYYQPWKFTRAQDDILDDQIADAKATIAREVEEFALRRNQHDRAHGHRRLSTSQYDKKEPDAAARSAPPPAPSTVPSDVTGSASAAVTLPVPAEATNEPSVAKSVPMHDAHQQDEPGDDVVEAEEDTVMY
ncbi:hypothetical protein VD0002_g2176 [Verticillium dahliae]|uniref:Pinin/SDK/MemA protein domain-containing protein n=2 Tax=Verticillium dahliae TaxID=27337 RepID=G2X7W0_VERDV|nr:uncharacterized protein VDAG_06568 [Verticillium dahliae VdLs.17]KAF3347689.1 DnaJ-like protein subfamily C member 7-like protein [Verticillium dahliae VDG2]KAF3354991.1 hypothetical protein VdG1_04416 [Verticillium dahliae VDG1]KAH6694454.1 pinin/SDK/memA/ protein conserved region-domain-containing protein [Verticillium dahliae]EGY15078.1 hypothetical protein VDAG_06568 [Verticillium dahliae VdLs.17]PNH27541.1 hypothetical protein BJF96_g9150 [Verticillium dahliae]